MGLFGGGKISQKQMDKWQKMADKEVAARRAKGMTCRNCRNNNGRGACTVWNKPVDSSSNCTRWQA